MSENNRNDTGGEGIAVAVLLVFIFIIGDAVADWIDDHSEEITLFFTIVGAGLGVAITTFILYKIAKARAKTRNEAERQRRIQIKQTYDSWLVGIPRDHVYEKTRRTAGMLELQLLEQHELLREVQGRDTNAMLPTHKQQHEETLTAVRASVKTLEQHTRMWRERLAVLTAQQTFQCALRSVPPWLGGAPFEDRPKDSEDLWPKKPGSIPAALAETKEALKKVDAALVSMKKVEQQMVKELAGASREAKMHLQTLLERAQGLRDRLATRLVECQTHEDRQRAYALIAKTPAGTLRAGELDAFFPKDIEPIDTELLMSVPQSFDLEDKLAELKAAVDRNVAAGSADHEVEALTQAPGGHVLPPRRPRTTR